MQATIVLHNRETHVQFFYPDSSHFYVINHPSHWTREDAELNVENLIKVMGMYLSGTYSETNELGEEIVCLFLRDYINPSGA